MNIPKIKEETLIKKLTLPTSKIRVVLDTDAYNEVDDQFAIVHALLSQEKMNVEAIYAAPFYNDRSSSPRDGMVKSYEEIKSILNLLPKIETQNMPILKGSEEFLKSIDQPYQSEAASDLVARAMATPDDDPLYVVAIGAITNIASAIIMEPRIINKIVLVWLGGNGFHWHDTKEFNLQQDVISARIIFDSGVPLVLLPCMGVTSHLHTTLPEIEKFVKGKGEIGDFLAGRYKDYHHDHFAYSKVIWDISAIAYLVDEKFVSTSLVRSPILTDELKYEFDTSRHLIRYVDYVDRDLIFKDLFTKLSDYSS